MSKKAVSNDTRFDRLGHFSELTKDVQNVEIIQKNGVGNAAKAYMISASMISTDFKMLFYMYLF